MEKGRVLLVDPRRETRLIYAELLRELADCDVEVADSPEKARVTLRPGAIDLLVTHVHFYQENGDRDYERAAQFCHDARDTVRKNLPIIGLTSIEFGPKQKEQYKFPEDLQPFHIDYDRSKKLVEMVRNVLHGSKGAKP
jgi:CheY-like chemotaxis protein